jgi:MATE family multidrug resistance protein
MIGSAVQNAIALSDSIFLLYYDATDFAAIGIVGIFYLIVSAIGYGFSKGGQILIARRNGQFHEEGIGPTLTHILLFQAVAALIVMAFLYGLAEPFLSVFIDNPLILSKSIDYLEYRSWSLIFSYVGLGLIAFYTGISRTTFILVDVLWMLIINLVLNYALIFGHWGMPEMGIKGAGLASAIAEISAFFLFVLYLYFDKNKSKWGWTFHIPPETATYKSIIKIGAPVVAQMMISLGSWFVFFSLIEGYGERALAVSNLVRILFLFFSIPVWGFSSGINTIASTLIGRGRASDVLIATRRTVILTLICSLGLAIPILGFPEITLQFLDSGLHIGLLADATPILRLLIPILALYGVGGIYFNGLVGTGDTLSGLYIQFFAVILYVVYLYLIIKVFNFPILLAWTGELFFWFIIILLTTWYLRSGRWQNVKF